MKVLLISVNNERDPYPVAPIGAAYIARALKDGRHDVRILDLCFVEDDFKAIGETLKAFLPDVIGISIRNIDNLTFNKSIFYLPRIRQLVEFVKENTSATLVAGGSGFSIFPEEALRYLGLDIGVVGEGEAAFTRFVDALTHGGRIDDIQNLCYMKDGKFYSNRHDHLLKKDDEKTPSPSSPPIKGGEIIESPLPRRERVRVRGTFHSSPDRSLLNNSAYLELGGMANIQSKRGCPFKCSYCTYPNIDGNKLRLREPADVVEELKEMKSDYNIDYVFFVDDIFNFPEEHAAGICEEMVKNDLNLQWTCFASPKGMTPELAGLMKRAGCRGVEFGSDAGAEKTLKGLGKHFTPDDISHAAECCKKIGLPNAHYIIMGGPEEDHSTLKETFSLFEKIRPTAVIALLGLRIYPNTRLHVTALEDGVVSKNMSLLEPVFYLSPAVDADAISLEVSEHAKDNHNWIAPGLNIRCDADMLTMLRKRGHKGPLWNIL
ncbi:MAG: cobalamin B12-binding domain-containing protein [Nitrospirae bacterium]|nr:cobalamin B12-binding domain-containing protein [Nitrospirota bacterium]